MNFRPRALRRALPLAAATAAVLIAGPAAAAAAPSATVPAATVPGATTARAAPATRAGRPITYRDACAAPRRGTAACLAVLADDIGGHPLGAAAASAVGLHPYLASDLRSAYRLPVTRGAGQTIAIVDAYDDPNAEADLAQYRSANKLPKCTTAHGCFRKVNESGGLTPPPPDPSWSVEISLDLDMASAVCPKCKLLLVEATDDSDVNLARAEDEAVALGATVVSNSYGGPEYPGQAALAKYYSHRGVVIVASSGDSGFGVSVPAAYGTLIAAGGTTLYRSSGKRGWGELAWSGAGSGCSGYVAKPHWQHDLLCAKRVVADVSAVADPDTPVAIYDSYQYPGWVAVGGTSVASPIIAGVFALAGNGAHITAGQYLYSHRAGLFDVTSGSNGYCGGSYLCTAKKGYDGPTGLGTPDGTSAF